jgi:hypothetical protein
MERSSTAVNSSAGINFFKPWYMFSVKNGVKGAYRFGQSVNKRGHIHTLF